ncbi:DUF7115 domain-containing protein [Halomicrobium salinisoli]|uniref:DUF7115 domain-containing protein n=1 Tax=Halomicrobium salinisoli TaxID=2878391 RepID=UPI001CF00F47|nr:hypothetical protein [Halomicrobium salinisoli]
MEIPDLVQDALGDEEVQAGVSLGDEDTLCFTPTRTLIYRGEGLLSDEDVSEYPHDFERLSVSAGRRKTTFSLTYVDGKREFSVPGNRADPVLERLLESALRVNGVIEPDEGLAGVFRFSELTLAVADQRMLKHVGEYTWDGDYEAFAYDDVTGLHFEDGSVATAVVLAVDGRPERIKAPNDQAALLRKTLEEALFEYHGVGSLDELNRALETDDEGDDGESTADQSESSRGLGLDADIDPLVGGDDGTQADSAPEQEARERPAGEEGGQPRAESEWSSANAGGAGNADSRSDDRATAASADRSRSAGGGTGTAETTQRPTDRDDDLAAVEEQLAELTEAVQRQNELLERQQQTVKQLIKELRQGR